MGAKGKSSLGLDENIAGALCYVAWWVTGLIFLLLEKESQYVKFHAMQSFITFFGATILLIILNALSIGFWLFLFFFWWIIYWIISLLLIVLWIVLLIKAYQGEKFKLPIIGDYAEQYAYKAKPAQSLA